MIRDITGLMVKYYHTCHRELWLYANYVDVDRTNMGIQHGSAIDETSYADKRRSILIDGTIAVDMLDDETIVEVKRSSSLEEPAIMQLRYYLWYLQEKKNADVTGEMAYPTERKREPVELTDADRDRFPEIIADIEEIISQDVPPEAEEKPICENCAYHDLCWV
jgi:CRISPR-associated exonuclease Cas4